MAIEESKRETGGKEEVSERLCVPSSVTSSLLGIEPRAVCILGKYSTSASASPSPSLSPSVTFLPLWLS